MSCQILDGRLSPFLTPPEQREKDLVPCRAHWRRQLRECLRAAECDPRLLAIQNLLHGRFLLRRDVRALGSLDLPFGFAQGFGKIGFRQRAQFLPCPE